MSQTATKTFKLSPSTLSVFRDCPRCFWLDKIKSIKRPRGIFPSLPSGMDRVIKVFFDEYRVLKKPPGDLKGPDFQGVELFEDQKQLDLWRDWKTGLQYKSPDGSVLFGALDDLLVKDGKYIPFDYKTKGSPTNEESAVKYYQTQLDCYSLMLEANGLDTEDYGFLLYFSPKTVRERGGVEFEVQPIKIALDSRRAKAIFENAIQLLNGPLPLSAPACEYCAWLRHFKTPFKS
ncbi:MAG: hypothetical protein EXS63_05735 [Candidatus Omnitrophica bacterium]|nr:hypothetical protein [Candidatus Omnitrophota bacterium]